jgi:type I restriction enzyme, S subunit
MFAAWTPSALLETRLDSHFYDPVFIDDEQRLEHFARTSLESSTVDGVAISYGVIKPRFCRSECALIRIQDFDDPFADVAQSATIDPDQCVEFGRSNCLPGDLLIAIGGYPGRIALVPALPPNIRSMNINQHVARIRLDPTKIAPHFVAGFFLSVFGHRMLERQISGAVQTGVNLGDLRKLRVPCLGADAQAYIGNKVRLAETLRVRTRELQTEAQRITGSLFPAERRHATRRPELTVSRIPPQLLLDRLNAEPYSPTHLNDIRRIGESGLKCHPLEDLMDGPINNSIRNIDGELDSPGNSIPMFRPADIVGWWLNSDTAPKLSAEFEEQHKKARVAAGDLVLGAAGTVAAVGRVPHFIERGNVNGSSARLKVKPEFRGYLLVYFNTALGRRTLERWAVGAVQKHLNLIDLPSISVPVPDETVLQELNGIVDATEHAYWIAKRLPTTARFLVEALIEQKVTEAELIAAHKDAERDRELLARLTTKGLDVADAPPLFPDLDALFELLDSCNEDEEES